MLEWNCRISDNRKEKPRITYHVRLAEKLWITATIFLWEFHTSFSHENKTYDLDQK